jgi:hypothetical protein
MKQVLLIASIAIILLSHHAKAQVVQASYKKVTTDHWKDDKITTHTVKYKTGSLIVKKDLILIDTSTDKPQVYKIVERGVIDNYDYGDFIQLLTVVYPAKSGLKAMEVVLYLDKSKHITNVILKKTKNSNVDYSIE